MIDIARQIPTQNIVTLRIDEAILGDEIAVEWGHAGDVPCRKGLIKRVADSGDSAAGNQLRGHHALANFLVDKSEFGMRMNHVAPSLSTKGPVCLSYALSRNWHVGHYGHRQNMRDSP